MSEKAYESLMAARDRMFEAQRVCHHCAPTTEHESADHLALHIVTTHEDSNNVDTEFVQYLRDKIAAKEAKS